MVDKGNYCILYTTNFRKWPGFNGSQFKIYYSSWICEKDFEQLIILFKEFAD